MIKQQRREAAEKLRKDRKAKRKSDQAELERLAKERRKKEINLNRMSGGGISSGGRGGGDVQNVTCHNCGQKGHLQRDCPRANGKKVYGDSRTQKRKSEMDYD